MNNYNRFWYVLYRKHVCKSFVCACEWEVLSTPKCLLRRCFLKWAWRERCLSIPLLRLRLSLSFCSYPTAYVLIVFLNVASQIDPIEITKSQGSVDNQTHRLCESDNFLCIIHQKDLQLRMAKLIWKERGYEA